MSEPIHPTYGTLDEFLKSLGNDIRKGYYMRIGQEGALHWFAVEFAKHRTQPTHPDKEG